jgi:hypothetical protein
MPGKLRVQDSGDSNMKVAITRNRFFFALLTMLLLSGGCVSKPHPDPLAGWQLCRSTEPIPSNKMISDDYHDYIKTLPPEERRFVNDSNISVFKDSTGQHAVKIEIPLNGTRWEHNLIYDKDNRRIRVTKHKAGRYQS